MKKRNSKIGSLFTWYDFIKPKKNKDTGVITYQQSNTKMDNYSQRFIGVHITHNNQLYIAVAVNKKGDTGNWWKFIIENRISKALENDGTIYEDDRGVTMVPIAYKDLLYKDPYAYQNLYGIIDPTYLDMAIKEAMKINNRMIDNYNARRNKDY